MLLKPNLSRTPETDPGLDAGQLQAIGLEHVRRLARRLWTDHNTHDPGITMLELLCFALTELTYRANFPLEDLLSGGKNDDAAMAKQFFTARNILPNRALTELDYRKLVIDLPDVKNAWVVPAPLTLYADTAVRELRRDHPGTAEIREVAVQGRYKVLVEFMDSVELAQRQAVCDDAMALLAASRNLCEDFVEVAGVETQPYAVCAELELESGADADAVAAALQFRVQRYFAPPVPNYGLAEMLARQHPDGTPYTAPEIFEGPLLKCGFIDEADLAAAGLREEVRLSDIVSIIMDIPGVRAIRDILVNPLDEAGQPLAPPDKWRQQVPPGRQPRLSIERSRLVCYKRHTPLRFDDKRVAALRLELENREKAKLETPDASDMPIPAGRQRQAGSYHSFQHHFPAIYGLSAQGLPPGSTAQRQAQAMQLKAYLLFFDQVMANYSAQLANVCELFSRDPLAARTYFSQHVTSVAEWTNLYDAEMRDGDSLARLFESEEDACARREHFIDHLLARFAEDFRAYANLMRSLFAHSTAATQDTKYAFLRDLPSLGAERALAYNYRLQQPEALWNSCNISGLERRLARLLGIPNARRRNLSKISYDIYAELDATPGDEFRFRVMHPGSGKILLSSSTRYNSKKAARAEMIRAIERAKTGRGYQRKTTVEKADEGERTRYYFNIVDEEKEVIARRIEYFHSESARDAAIDELILHLNEYYSGEGMYLIENLLLLPQEKDDPLLPICVDTLSGDCPDDDPYSYRLHIVLPAEAGRFDDMDFRRFAEETIRREVPAHILPKICWIGTEAMAEFERAYRDWIGLRAGVSSEQRTEKLEAIRDALYRTAKNAYPPRNLYACSKDESKPSFILGRGALGSKDD